jgi:hypothetical protein
MAQLFILATPFDAAREVRVTPKKRLEAVPVIPTIPFTLSTPITFAGRSPSLNPIPVALNIAIFDSFLIYERVHQIESNLVLK